MWRCAFYSGLLQRVVMEEVVVVVVVAVVMLLATTFPAVAAAFCVRGAAGDGEVGGVGGERGIKEMREWGS